MQRKQIAVLGAGFGGLRTAMLVGRGIRRLGLAREYEVVLVDRNEHHTYTPLLYEAATTSKDIATISKLHRITTLNIHGVIEHLPIAFLQDEVTAVDPASGTIAFLHHQPLTPAFTVLALGSETNFFNIPGLKQHAFTLKTFKDAVRLRDTVWSLAEDSATIIRIVVGGGGTTGVELAGELESWRGQLRGTFPLCGLEITIVESQKTVLYGFDTRVVAKITKRLEHLGIKAVLNERIAEVKDRTATLVSGRTLPFDIFVWTGGVQPPKLISKLPFGTATGGRIEATGEMECIPPTPSLKLTRKIYALGDIVCFYDPKTHEPVPGVAPAAIDEATVAAHNILEEIKAAKLTTYNSKLKTYIPHEYPYVIPSGGKWAVAKIGPFVISGFSAWIFKGLIELYYLASIMSIPKAVNVWLKGLWVFIRNDRLG